MLSPSPLNPSPTLTNQDGRYTKKTPKITKKWQIFGAIIFKWCNPSHELHKTPYLFVYKKH